MHLNRMQEIVLVVGVLLLCVLKYAIADSPTQPKARDTSIRSGLKRQPRLNWPPFHKRKSHPIAEVALIIRLVQTATGNSATRTHRR